MEDKALYLLAEFDKETQKILYSYYSALEHMGFVGRQSQDIPYHITLGNCDVSEEIRLVNEMKLICEKYNEIDIRLDHIGLFGLDVLFIEPNLNFELLKLHKEFFNHSGIGYHNWTPHTTILMEDSEQILKAIPIISELFHPCHARIQSVSLYEYTPSRFIQRCILSKTDK